MDSQTKPTLLILAAGMGSRYGGLKQIESVGPSGESILDYSVYDALKAGFGKIVFVIRKDIEVDFKKQFKTILSKNASVIFQDIDALPDHFKAPNDRLSPWGTAHAIFVAKDHIKEPFAVINADDFYGFSAFKTMCELLSNPHMSIKNSFFMVAYKLSNTLSDFGNVSRAICQTNQEAYLTDIIEKLKIGKYKDHARSYNSGSHEDLTGQELVSMNFWGFPPIIFKYLELYFKAFLEENINTPKSEFQIPKVIQSILNETDITLKVSTSPNKWFGITYPEDKNQVTTEIKRLCSKGLYPNSLWYE